MAKKYILAILPEYNRDVAERILDDFESKSEEYVIIRLTPKQLFSKPGYFFKRVSIDLRENILFKDMLHAIKTRFSRIILKRRKAKFEESKNPIRIKEGKSLGSRVIRNAVYRFSPKLVVVFDRTTLRQLAYARRKSDMVAKIAYIETRAKFNNYTIMYNCDNYAVQTKNSIDTLLANGIPEKNITKINYFDLFKVVDNTPKKKVNQKYYSTILLNAEQFSKRDVKRIIETILPKYKEIKLYISTALSGKLYDFVTSISCVKECNNVEIVTTPESCIRYAEYSIINTQYKNYVSAIANNSLPIVYSGLRLGQSQTMEYYRNEKIAICVNNAQQIGKVIETLLDSLENELEVRANIKEMLANSSKKTTFDYITQMAGKLDSEHGVEK